MSVKVLSFVTHAPVSASVSEMIDQAFDWGVDVIAAQGTSTDWGAYWLGSGEQVNTVTNLKENVRPFLRAAVEHQVPFVFSVGLAGGDVHLQECLDRIDELCVEEGWVLNIGVLSGEISKERLHAALEAGLTVRAAYNHPDLSPVLTKDDVDASIRVVGLLGVEPIIKALETGVDGVITGRALDIGLHMAVPMMRGIPRHVAAHAGKVIECGGVACEKSSASNPVWADIDEEGFTVRSCKPDSPATIRSIAAHCFYERSNPFQETNPGGVLDLTEVTYEQLDANSVRCEGARWVDAPYSVLIEGAKLLGYRTIAVMTAKDPGFIAHVDELIEQMHGIIDRSPQTAGHKRGADFDVTAKVFGPNQGKGEGDPVAIIVDAVAETPELADTVAFVGYSHIHAGHFEGRLTTAGNVSFAYMPILQQLGAVYAFSVYHVLPLDDPSEPFAFTPTRFPRQ
jgi:hypothetical protein